MNRQTPLMTVDLKKQWLQLWQSHRRLWILFFITLLMDALSTIHFMQSTGPDAELHPAVRLVSSLFGTVVGPLIAVLAKALAAVAVIFCCKRLARIILLTASALYLFAFFYNLFAVDLYLSGLLPWLPI